MPLLRSAELESLRRLFGSPGSCSFDDVDLPDLNEHLVSLHEGPPGDILANETAYFGYARQVARAVTQFPMCVGGTVTLATHAAVSVRGVVVLVVELEPVTIAPYASPVVRFGDLAEAYFGRPTPQPTEAKALSRFEAVAAELVLDERGR